MSPMTRILFGVGLALVLLACSVDAHGWMTNPKPRGQYRSPARYPYEEYAPATINPNDPNFVCRSDPEMPRANWLQLSAGTSQSINLQFTAPHVGDCFVYLTYDGNKPDSSKKWFKIWQQHDCKSSNNYNIAIPDYLPSGEHVVFRWEWYALHAYPKVEYYAQCVDAVMSGKASGVLPQPQVNIPGHLPVLDGAWESNSNNYWWPYGNQQMRFTGPELAKRPDGGSSSTTGSPATPAPTPAPTRAPTTAPTSAPTSAPTKAPAAPTTAPTAPPPTSPPAPTSAPATQAPTVRPPTQPTTRPPAASVKLSVTASASEWWFAVTVAGQRAEEVTKVEIKDSGCVEEYEPMSNDWADVWVFDPNGEPLVFPLTVKASLPSGASLTFVVNSLPATTVDSGSVFAY